MSTNYCIPMDVDYEGCGGTMNPTAPCDYECPVCYTTDASSGVVIPACGHKLCITCYSTILLQGAACARCPSCRADYPKIAAAKPPPKTVPRIRSRAQHIGPAGLPSFMFSMAGGSS